MGQLPREQYNAIPPVLRSARLFIGDFLPPPDTTPLPDGYDLATADAEIDELFGDRPVDPPALSMRSLVGRFRAHPHNPR